MSEGNSYTDENGYKRSIYDIEESHSNLISRKIAYKHIYDSKTHHLPFSEYVVHHIDRNKKNNDVSNLKLLTKDEHDKIHKKGKYAKPKETSPSISVVSQSTPKDYENYWDYYFKPKEEQTKGISSRDFIILAITSILIFIAFIYAGIKTMDTGDFEIIGVLLIIVGIGLPIKIFYEILK